MKHKKLILPFQKVSIKYHLFFLNLSEALCIDKLLQFTIFTVNCFV